MSRAVNSVVLATTMLVTGSAGYYAGRDPSASCTEATPRSSRWPKVRAEHLRRHPLCDVCSGRDDIQVHHVEPFHKRPDLELEPSNLVTLCRRHHFLVGHLEEWRSWNSWVREDAATWAKRLKARP